MNRLIVLIVTIIATLTFTDISVAQQTKTDTTEFKVWTTYEVQENIPHRALKAAWDENASIRNQFSKYIKVDKDGNLINCDNCYANAVGAAIGITSFRTQEAGQTMVIPEFRDGEVVKKKRTPTTTNPTFAFSSVLQMVDSLFVTTDTNTLTEQQTSTTDLVKTTESDYRNSDEVAEAEELRQENSELREENATLRQKQQTRDESAKITALERSNEELQEERDAARRDRDEAKSDVRSLERNLQDTVEDCQEKIQILQAASARKDSILAHVRDSARTASGAPQPNQTGYDANGDHRPIWSRMEAYWKPEYALYAGALLIIYIVVGMFKFPYHDSALLLWPLYSWRRRKKKEKGRRIYRY